MNLARARRRWRLWDRYADRCIRLCGRHHVAAEGHWRAYNRLARWHNRKVERQARRDAHLIVGAVLKKLDESRAAA